VGDGGSEEPQVENLVKNPSFEDGSASWTFISVETSTVTNYAGTSSLRLNALGDKAEQPIAVVPGVKYNFSFWVYSAGMTGPKLVADTFDEYDDTCQFLITTANNEWKQYSGAFTATDTSVTLRFFTSQIFAGTIYVDDVVLSAEPGYDTWGVTNGVTGTPTDDDDNDGQSNLLEYALNGLPRDGQPAAAPVLKMANGEPVYCHLRRNDDPNLIYEVVICTNLMAGGWTTNGVFTTGPADSGNEFDEVTNSISSASQKVFVRLNVIQP